MEDNREEFQKGDDQQCSRLLRNHKKLLKELLDLETRACLKEICQ